ncbi:hypothetical protein XENTR_v10002716 [Xenopus tropicalis]|uniref:Uncharacterized protein LOC100497254 n=1 Tax=Xenopus tropicalis TaxID=8364 RepID=A0A8J0SVJ3_XENTR|nr:uncharacterized protein LOC100497254 [Xenopus tropicalis]KAE8635719.1 hypothetical protein XENTR_v10002716 [Xenopus tropicalis]|eukprot:XP_012823526.1 PREDICTED: uncharacterized protein LOC100497254 [Xenopus tropicalis]
MSTSRSNSLEFTQARKNVHRSFGDRHLSFDPAIQANTLQKEDALNDFPSQASYKRTAGNEQKLEQLQKENVKLKQELEDLRHQHNQLLEESKYECFDERRVNLLKAQVIQLERQVMLLTEGLNSRASLLLEVDNSLQPILEKLRCLLASENHSADVPVSRAELIRMIEICKATSDKLHQNHQATSVDNLALMWILSEKQATKSTVTLLDLCFGKLENLNLLYVSALEGKLCTLFRQLHATKETLSLILSPGKEVPDSAYHILPKVIYARLMNHLTVCSQYVEDCSKDLLTMTLIVPSAPWAKMAPVVSHEFTVENVLAALPALPKGAPQQRAKRAAEALVKAASYSRLMALQQIHALEAELDFHRSIYSLQVQYTEALFQGIKQAYHSFQENVASVVCCPLKEVLTSYAELKSEASETALRNFLTIFKSNVEQIQDAVDTLTPSKTQQHEGDEALSKLGKDFFLALEQSLKTCGEQRDKSAYEIKKLKDELDQSLETLNNLRKERKERGGSSKNSVKSEAGSDEKAKMTSADQEEKSDVLAENVEHRSKHSQPVASSKETQLCKHESLQIKQGSGKEHNQRSKSLQRSKSVKYPARPPWQD